MYLHDEEVHNTSAARIILPIILDFLKPKSALDIGCGIGTWLFVAKELGINEVKGVDGDYVDRKLLRKYLSDEEFISHDLTLPISLGQKFDLCLCLEVAEHLPESAARTLVETLVGHSDILLFSASIPGQGGQNHINEQIPEFWKSLFEEYDYNFIDCIRPIIWNYSEVDFWYKQNIFLVVKKSIIINSPITSESLLKIHPDLLALKNKQIEELKKKLDNVFNGSLSPKAYLNLLKKSLFKK